MIRFEQHILRALDETDERATRRLRELVERDRETEKRLLEREGRYEAGYAS